MGVRNLMLVLADDAKKNSEVESTLKARGYAIIRAEGREDALRKMRSKTFDLLVCDTVHIKSGLPEFVQALETSGSSRIPILLFSDNVWEDEKTLFKQVPGAKALVPRNVDMPHLEKIVATNLPADTPIPGLEPDDDSDKPLYDRRDNVSIDIGAQVSIGGSAHFKAALVEYEEGSVLLDIGQNKAKKGDNAEVIIRSQGGDKEAAVQFSGSVLSVEEVDGGGTLVSIDSRMVAQDIAKNIMGQVVKRQSDLLKFIRDTQD
jgi:CheY-like chemotaxis protein